MQAAGIILVALVVYADAQPHPGRCPRLNTPPPEPTDDSCHWVVKVDFRGCRYYFEECWKPNMCTGKNEMLWICSSECPPTCAEKWPGCGEQCGSPCCQCVGGYVRDSRGVCIPIQDCPDENPPALCGPNERFVNCSSLCEPTCQSKPNQPCPYVCGPPKCECLPGYVRDQGKCILPKQCPSADPTCGPNEEFVTCSSACEPTCESPPNQPCILMCGPPKCQCRPGFVRHQGRCILRSQCPSADPKPTCDPNERFVECSSLCEPTCESPTGQPCVKKCGPPKCECLPGFVRDHGKCIPPDQCPSIGPPAICGPNERFVNCSSLCEPTCQSKPNQPCPLVCGEPKCECLPGYVRDQGKCILPEQCPSADPTCGPNEEFVTCSSKCEPTCESPPDQPCILMCGPPKCQCRPGFVRHQGRCIPRSQCPSADPEPESTCGPNERFVECSTLCEPTCEWLTGQPCVKKCGPPKCECLPGFVRDQGKCIPPDQCPSIGGS